MSLIARYVIYGEPAIKKNGKRIIRMGNIRRIISSKRYEKWGISARKQLKFQADRLGIDTITKKIHMKMVFYKAYNNDPDLSNMYEGPQDEMQAVGIFVDDNLVESHDGSRKHYLCPTCPARDKYVRGSKKGTYKPDCGKKKECPYNRVEIELHTFSGRTPKDIFKDRASFVIEVEKEHQKGLLPPEENFRF